MHDPRGCGSVATHAMAAKTPRTKSTNKVLVTREQAPRGIATSRFVQSAALAMLSAMDLTKHELSVLLCDDRVIHRLNKTYRSKDKPTDVLAFALREGERGDLAGAVLGDVVLSLETAKKQATERKIPVETEVLTLLAHGILHLLGWDHQTDRDDRRMRKETSRLVEAARAGDRTRAPRARVS